MVSYPVGDFLIKIKNVALAEGKHLKTRNSKFVAAVADVLKKEGILKSVDIEKNTLNAEIAYHKKSPALIDLKIVSKPGLRKYMTVDEIKSRKRSRSTILILSTPEGVMTSRQSVKKNIGGEVLAEIW